MTRDEQIDKARWAMLTAKCKCGQAGEGGACSRCEAEAALDAADVEGMVRRAASEGIDLGWDACETRMPEDEFREKRDEIVRRVCG